MKPKTIAIPILLSLLLVLGVANVVGRTSPTDVLQTIPPIIVSGPNAIAGCTVLSTSPGSIVQATSGFLMATCPNNAAAVTLRGTQTPTFLLATGLQQIAIMLAGYPCSFQFRQQFGNTFETFGANITSGSPITFTDQPANSTSLPSGSGYNYCLYYVNAPVGGLTTFTIAWA